VLDEVADVSRAYSDASVVLDQFGQEFVAQGLTACISVGIIGGCDRRRSLTDRPV
jgi:hypothetical protein